MTLEMLESKVQRILHLENELRATKRQLQQLHDFGSVHSGSLEGSLSSIDLQESRAECRRLRRQNLMLKLLLEELEESRIPEEPQSLDDLKALECDDGPVSLKEEAVHVSSETNQACQWCDTGELVSGEQVSLGRWADASSAYAEALFQKEIERFSGLDNSNSSLNRSRGVLH